MTVKHYYTADFETTTPKDKAALENSFKQTEVWGAGICKVGDDDVKIFGCIKDFLSYCGTLEGSSPIIYFHNLKFDGSFIIDYLMRYLEYKHSENMWTLKNGEFSTSISGQGVWYMIRVRWGRKVLEFRDSLKLLPFSVDQIAKQLSTRAQKLVGSIDYRKERKLEWVNENGRWTKRYLLDEEETKYLKNDILVMAEALQMVQEEFGLLNYLTIGSACMADYKNRVKKFDLDFPLLEKELDTKLRRSYHGGWCYVKEPEKEFYNIDGRCYDVNSLYPWAMHSNDNHYYPVGTPHHFTGDKFHIFNKNLYILHIYVDIELKENKLPFIQLVKNGPYIEKTEGLVELWLTRPDYELLIECYDILMIDIVEGYSFGARKGVFDEYIEHWYEVKKTAPNKVIRLIAKLMLNNLYGKFGTSPDTMSYVPILNTKEDKISMTTRADERKSVYIPVAAFITSYARCKTIRAAIENIDVFKYADTDSIHTTGPVKNIAVGKELGEWKEECKFDKAKYVRCKTYIEHITEEDGEAVENYWLIKAAGAPDTVKERMQYKVNNYEDLTIDEEYGIIINEKRTDEEFMKHFSVGLVETGKLGSKRIKGGVVLVNTTFQIRPS